MASSTRLRPPRRATSKSTKQARLLRPTSPGTAHSRNARLRDRSWRVTRRMSDNSGWKSRAQLNHPMKYLIKRMIAKLPESAQLELRRLFFQAQIRRGSFVPEEREIKRLGDWLRPGDLAIDVGANIGYYTLAMAHCVGSEGRVLALEPMPSTFDLLAGNVRASDVRNVTLMNVAASSTASIATMDLPMFAETNLANLYEARLSSKGAFPVLCVPLDSIPLPAPVRLLKIDAEGHDLDVLEGAKGLIENHHPILIVEGSEQDAVADWIRERGYSIHTEPGSSNIVGTPRGTDERNLDTPPHPEQTAVTTSPSEQR